MAPQEDLQVLAGQRPESLSSWWGEESLRFSWRMRQQSRLRSGASLVERREQTRLLLLLRPLLPIR